MIHVFEDEAHWILGGRVNTEERYEALVPVATASQRLVMESLPVKFSVSRACRRVTGYSYHVGG